MLQTASGNDRRDDGCHSTPLHNLIPARPRAAQLGWNCDDLVLSPRDDKQSRNWLGKVRIRPAGRTDAVITNPRLTSMALRSGSAGIGLNKQDEEYSESSRHVFHCRACGVVTW